MIPRISEIAQDLLRHYRHRPSWGATGNGDGARGTGSGDSDGGSRQIGEGRRALPPARRGSRGPVLGQAAQRPVQRPGDRRHGSAIAPLRTEHARPAHVPHGGPDPPSPTGPGRRSTPPASGLFRAAPGGAPPILQGHRRGRPRCRVRGRWGGHHFRSVGLGRRPGLGPNRGPPFGILPTEGLGTPGRSSPTGTGIGTAMPDPPPTRHRSRHASRCRRGGPVGSPVCACSWYSCSSPTDPATPT